VKARSLFNRDATRATATLAGMWTSAGLGTFEVWAHNHPQDVLVNRVLLAATAVVFFYGPFFLFVAGPLQRRLGVRHVFTREYWADYPSFCIRGVCWFLGAATGGVVYSLWRYGTWAAGNP
jgi:hypothetical protein